LKYLKAARKKSFFLSGCVILDDKPILPFMDQNENEKQHQNDAGKDIISDYYQGYQQLELQSAETQVKKARNALFVVAGLTLIVNLVLLGSQAQFDSFSLVIVLLVTIIFAGLGLMTKKQPFAAIIIGLSIYVGLWILDIVVLGSEQFTRGLFLKGIIIYFLIKGLKHAREAERLKKEINR
jgi:xanthosine utilization system XapX-like protein